MEKQQDYEKKSHTKAANLEYEQKAWADGHQHVAGVDEAGRGPLAGPVVVGAVILGAEWNDSHVLRDSKLLRESQRNQLFDVIRKEALAYKIVVISEKEIDEINILQATYLGMTRSAKELDIQPDYVLVDGNRYPPLLSIPGETIVKGDQRSKSIAAASILAKVTRDRIMVEYSSIYPDWDFQQHKGYPTKKHREAIAKYGMSPIHRKSFCSKFEKTSASKEPEQLSLFG